MTSERLKEAIVCRVQHELRTPLTVASMAYELLFSPAADGPTADQCREMLGRALKTLEKHLRTFSILFGGSEGGLAPARAPTDLLASARGAVARVGPEAAERGVGVALEIRGRPRAVPADEGLVAEALERLLDNAVRFNRRGGLARLILKFRARSVKLTVTDDGPGIAKADLALALEGLHQAEEFLTRREGGLGAGLAVARAIALAHGGRLSAASRPGRGSAFTILLPEANDEREDLGSR